MKESIQSALAVAAEFQRRVAAQRLQAALDVVAEFKLHQAAPTLAEEEELALDEKVQELAPTEVERTEPATDPLPEVEIEEMDVTPVEEIHDVPPINEPVNTEMGETEAEHASHGGGEQANELVVRDEMEAVLSDPMTIEAAMDFLIDQEFLEEVISVEEGVWGYPEAQNFATLHVDDEEYIVAPSIEAVNLFAHVLVKMQLETNPDLFKPTWLEDYDESRLDDESEEKESESTALSEQAVEEASQDALKADGVGNFIGAYDGEIHDLTGGGVWWRSE